MPVDPETIKQGIGQAEAVFTMIGGLGAWETAKWAFTAFMNHRKARKDARDAELTAARDSGRAAVEQSRDRRKDALDEVWRIADEKEKQHHDCEERLAVVDKRLDDCEQDRDALRTRDDQQQRQINQQQSEINSLKGRVSKVENDTHA